MEATNITMTAGTISGLTPDLYVLSYSPIPSPVINTLASSTVSIISSGLNLRLTNSAALSNNLVFNVAQGTVPSGIDLLVSGAITSSQGGGIVKNGPGTLVLGSATGNNYNGGTTVNGGTLVLTNPAGATGLIRGTLTINSGGTVVATNKWALGYTTDVTNIFINGGTLDFTGDAATDLGGMGATNITMTGGTIASLSGTLPPDLFNASTNYGTVIYTLPASIPATISSGFNLRLTANSSLTLNVAQGTTTNGIDLAISGPLMGASTSIYSLIKSGAGTAQLGGVNSYTCPTTVSNGTLLITGSVNSPVSVYGGTLGGAGGTINYPVTIYSGGTLAVGGPSLGTLTLANPLTLNAGSTNYLRISKTGGQLANDTVFVETATLAFAGALTITNATSDGTPLAVNDAFTLFSGAGGYTGNFAVTNLPAPGNGLAWNWDPTTAVLSVVAGPTNTAPVLSGEGPWRSGSFPLTFSGPSNQTYEVLSATNVALPLAEWTVLTNGTFGAGPVIYTDGTATNKAKFYLIKSP
jgi:autotransporter-associated beta strand protein